MLKEPVENTDIHSIYTQPHLSGAKVTCQLLALPPSQTGPSNFNPPANPTGKTDTFLVFLICLCCVCKRERERARERERERERKRERERERAVRDHNRYIVQVLTCKNTHTKECSLVEIETFWLCKWRKTK